MNRTNFVNRTDLIAFSTLAAATAGAQAQNFNIAWSTLDGGGGTAVGGTFTLRGTIGQHDAGTLTGGAFTIAGGYWSASPEQTCYPDCDTLTEPGALDIFDFLCFQNRFDANDPYACDCDTTTGLLVCDVFDFLCFQNAYAAGCP